MISLAGFLKRWGTEYNTIQYNLFPPEVIPTVWLHTFEVSDDWYYFVQ